MPRCVDPWLQRNPPSSSAPTLSLGGGAPGRGCGGADGGQRSEGGGWRWGRHTMKETVVRRGRRLAVGRLPIEEPAIGTAVAELHTGPVGHGPSRGSIKIAISINFVALIVHLF